MPSASSRSSLLSFLSFPFSTLSFASSRRTPLVAFAALALLAAPGCAASGEDKVPPGGDGATGDGATDTSTGDDANPSDAPVDGSVGDGTPADGTPADATPADGTPSDAGGETCPTSCTVGATTCDGNAVRTCVTQGSCTGFGAKVDCPATQVCSAGKCAATCTDQCPLNDKRCSGTQIQTCDKQASGCTDWSMASNCPAPQACSGNVCKLTCTDTCTNGAKQCGGPDSTQLCALQTTGCYDWNAPTSCTGGLSCTAGACAPCTTGATRCGTTGNVEQCTSGAWAQTQSCAFGCSAGVCSSTITCTPGAYRCAASNVELCNASGTAWVYITTCGVGCSAGLCTGGCNPGDKRCNGTNTETCNATGTGWDATACTGGAICDASTAQCAPTSLTVDATQVNYEGVLVVNGPVVIKNNGKIVTQTGNLTIRATSITVDATSAIVAAAVWDTPRVADGTSSTYYGYGGGGGTNPSNQFDVTAYTGTRGGDGGRATGYGGTPGVGGNGGGAIRLYADTISFNGTATANGANGTNASSYAGGGGGGGGGSILMAADSLTVGTTATMSVAGGLGGSFGVSSYGSNGGSGGIGRIKLLYGTTKSVPASISSLANVTYGLMPPIFVSSTTHPNSALIYNDDFQNLTLTWTRPFGKSQLNYLQVLNQSNLTVPTFANGLPSAPSELLAYDRAKFTAAGSWWVHLGTIDPVASTAGTVENWYKVQVNTTPPPISSMSHPSSTTWNPTLDVQFAWTLPNGAAMYKGVHWVFDHNGLTIPTKADTFVPNTITSKFFPSSTTGNGIFVFHVISEDTAGYLTKNASHYVVRLGADPGTGTLSGTVKDSMGAGLSGAAISVNKGLFSTTSGTGGSYSFTSVIPPGTWTVDVTSQDFTLLP
jgi:hypothetical protein